MAYDDVLTRNDNEELSVRVVSVSEGTNNSTYDDIYTRDTNGKLAIRVVGAGGGGGDSHNLGYYETPEDLAEAHPTAEAGDWAIVNSTDTIWIWDTDNSQWVDSDTKGQVTPDMVIIKSATMPTASTVANGSVYQYIGTTNANYTHGYIYEKQNTSTYTSTVSFDPASISGTVATCSGDDFADLVVEWGTGNITDIIKGTLTYDESGGLLVFVGQDDTDTQVCTFQLYTQDYEDAGFTFTGTLQDGDVIAFTCAITENISSSWVRIDVQPKSSTYLTYPAGWTTNSTTKAFCDDIAADTTATVGKAYLGEVTFSDLPASMVNGEVIVEIMDGTTAQDKVIVLSLKSGNTAPYAWQYVYWNGGTDVSGWKTWQEPLVSGTNIKTINGTSILGSGDITITQPSTPATTPTLTSAGWSNSSQTITVTGVTASNIVIVSPAPASASDYAEAGIVCTAQATDSLTFTCDTTPSNDITLSVVIF